MPAPIASCVAQLMLRAASGGPQNKGDVVKLVRIVIPIITLLAFIVGVVAFASSSSEVAAPDGSSAIAAENTVFEANSARSENVDQQQVVAMWGIKGMTEVTAQQNATIIRAQVELLESQNQLVAFTRGSLVVLVMLTILIGVLGTTWLRLRLKEEVTPAGLNFDAAVDSATPSAEA